MKRGKARKMVRISNGLVSVNFAVGRYIRLFQALGLRVLEDTNLVVVLGSRDNVGDT